MIITCSNCKKVCEVKQDKWQDETMECPYCKATIHLLAKPELTEFTKHDAEKIRMELTDPAFNELVAKVLTYGANKYSADNWKKLTDKNRAIGALLRHIIAYQKGELIDPESKLPHLGHAACNLMFLNYIDENKPKEKT